MNFLTNEKEQKWNKKILKTLLLDRTTGKNIIWASSDYEHLGSLYSPSSTIEYKLITGVNKNLIQPRVLKSRENQTLRTRTKAEVFTPSWLCNKMNNLVDHAWFGYKHVFNLEKPKGWIAIKRKIVFPDNKTKTWKTYVDENRLEITCGEAPYLVSRYDTVSGAYIPINERIGLLDRKMRIVKENTNNEAEWLKWAQRAFESVYGFELQGDNLLIARKNLLASYVDYMQDALKREPSDKELLKIARIISWNLWQMDGLTFAVPNSQEINSSTWCVIKNWRSKKKVIFKNLIKES
ncbi:MULTISPECIES: hypothetical protein [unclassified Mycoplasma]|uniref:hypothetical protein n=1 Tax=unclassified Mycoplasma TaxID=2683645 RepID=UPI00211B91A3|nr:MULTISPECIES: hypothetical protein [unclassified Mycoplasma]UUM20134.1 hypothetical protein NPA11_01775 [Mycoplasma sp. 1578d]UUM25114.1 hypothetical protein NPA12_01750 [Mycoplasma sp. 3686d]